MPMGKAHANTHILRVNANTVFRGSQTMVIILDNQKFLFKDSKVCFTLTINLNRLFFIRGKEVTEIEQMFDRWIMWVSRI